MKISLLHPSRSRPEKSFMNSAEWMKKAGNVEVELIVSLDTDDPKLKTYTDIYGGAAYHIGAHKSVVEATNYAATQAKGDILVYLSDDFRCPDNWDELIIKEFEGEKGPLLVKVDDCLQKFEVPVLTIPIMNRPLYERLGYFWHPSYKSMFVDEDLYWTARKLHALKLAKHLKFPHEHPANGKAPNDETYQRSAANWKQGEAAFNKRRLAGFPL